MKKSRKLITRILALTAIVFLVGLAVLALVASLSDWENKENITILSIAGAIVIPILIYAVLLFAKKKDSEDMQ